jgi:hypothetical protein
VKTTSDPPSSKKSRRALSEFQAVRLGDVVLRRHRAYSIKNDFSNRRPKNSRPNLSTDVRLKIARASFDLRYPHQLFKAACVLSFDAQSLYRPCFERNWRRPRFVSLRAKKYAFAMRARRKSTLRQREAESSARRQKFVTTPPRSAKLDVRNSVKWAISDRFFRLVSNELNQSPFVCACAIADKNCFDV